MNVLALHGGAGDRDRSTTSVQTEQELTTSIGIALDAGYSALQNGASCIDAVETAIRILEDFPCFNAGRGSALNLKGEVELDAGIMDGASLRAGAIAGARTIKNPVSAARFVMDSTSQILYTAEAADEIARRAGLEMTDNDYFITAEVRKKFDEINLQRSNDQHDERVVLGTVGAVALDAHGNLCAANSTGGMMHKPVGRVGDTPIVGAGMYARNGVAAIACTGHGEYFIRTVAAHEATSLMRHKKYSLEESLNEVLGEITRLGGRGGMIGIDAAGNVCMKFTTSSMVRASIDRDGKKTIEVW